MLNDPSGEIRRDAIAAAMLKAEKLEGEAAKAEYERLFKVVRDQDQANAIVKVHEKHSVKPDVISHFGIVTKWMLVAPFDSTKGSKGMGIGAYQVREYIRLLGGDVEVQSSPGQGTRFALSLPVAQSPEARSVVTSHAVTR